MKGAIHEYQHKNPTIPYNTPRKWQGPEYGAKTQWAANASNKPILPHEDRKYKQNVVGKCLYYDIAVDPTMLVALVTLVVAHSKGTENTKQAGKNLLY